MSGSKVPRSVWLNNFKKSLQELIDDELGAGRTVTAIMLTPGLYAALSEALKYNPTDILGYVLEVIDTGEIQIEGEEEVIMIRGNVLN